MSSSTGLKILAAGIQGTLQGVQGRQEAKIRKAEGEAKLAKLNYQEETGAVQQQIDALNAKNRELEVTNSRNAMYRALDAYSADGDTRHLNDVSKNDPMLKTRFSDMASLDKIDVENDANLINSSARIPENMEWDENARNRFLRITKTDGTKEVLDMQNVYAGTGYTKYLDKQKLETLLTKSKLQAKIDKAKGSDTALVRNARAAAAAKDRIAKAEEAGETPSTKDVELVAGWESKKSGTTAGKLGMAEQATKDLVESFGGREAFFATSFDRSTPEGNANYLDAYHKVATIEKAEGRELSSTQKTQINDIRVLIALGDPSEKLTDKDTGLWDHTLHNAKKYVTDNVGGTAATSAYAAFRNSTRHALFGSALTPAEIESFRQAFGSLGQKLGPVVTQFKTALTQVKAKLESISSMQNPYSAHVRLGVDADKLDKTISAIDERLAALDSLGTVKPKRQMDTIGGRRR